MTFMPSFSDILRGNFSRREETSLEQVNEESKTENKQKNTNLFDAVEQQVATPLKVHTQVRCHIMTIF
jgi:hypothetical protein